MRHISVVRGDVTTLPIDAIVNAANEWLTPGAGVCGAIHASAGPRLATACAAIGHCAPGDAIATPGFDLPARWVIHAVGPVWDGGGFGERGLLSSCYRRGLEVAVEVGAAEIAFPSISTGIFGFPKVAAAGIAVHAVRAFDGPITRVVLVAFTEDDECVLREAVESP